MFSRSLNTALRRSSSKGNQVVKNLGRSEATIACSKQEQHQQQQRKQEKSQPKQKNEKNEKQNVDKYQQLKDLKFRPLYLDAQATSPIDPRVLDAMLPYMTGMYGNPHSRTHAYGWESEQAVEKAREV